MRQGVERDHLISDLQDDHLTAHQRAVPWSSLVLRCLRLCGSPTESWARISGTVLAVQLRHVAYLDEEIECLSAEITERERPFADALERLQTIPGVASRPRK